MESIIAFFTAPFPPEEREYAMCMRLVAEYLEAVGIADSMEPVPFNCFGFGLFAPGRSADPTAHYIAVWFDDPYPCYWVQIRASQEVDGEMPACELCFGVEDAAATVQEFIPRLLDLVSGTSSV